MTDQTLPRAPDAVPEAVPRALRAYDRAMEAFCEDRATRRDVDDAQRASVTPSPWPSARRSARQPLLTFAAAGAGVHVALDRLVASRMLLQANSGGGKSRALRYLLEQTHGRVQHLIIDPEGEFASLRERFPYLLAGKDGDVAADPKSARLLCRRVLELGASTVLDLYELKLEQRREFVRAFLEELMHLPRALWRPLLVVIDEAHVFAPERGSGESVATDAVITLATQGRKRGYCLIAATQRLSKLHKDVAAELLNKMIGRTGLDVDLKRAGDELGLDKEQRQALKFLAPGTFYVYGPAIANEVTIARTGDVQTTHPQAGTIGAAPPPASAEIAQLVAQLQDLPRQADEEARTVGELQQLVRQLKHDLTRVQRSSPAPDPAALQAATAAAVARAVAAAERQHTQTRQKELDELHRLADAISRAPLADAAARVSELQGEIEILRGQPPGKLELLPEPAAAALRAKQPASRVPDPTARNAAMLATYEDTERMAIKRNGAATISGPQQRMLDALAAFEAIGIADLAWGQLAVCSGQSPKSSSYEKNVSTLRSAARIAALPGKRFRLTIEGRAIANAPDRPVSLRALHDAWSHYISGPQWRMLNALISTYPHDINYEELAKVSSQSPTSSSYEKNIAILKNLGLIAKDPGAAPVRATDLLFPAGLR